MLATAPPRATMLTSWARPGCRATSDPSVEKRHTVAVTHPTVRTQAATAGCTTRALASTAALIARAGSIQATAKSDSSGSSGTTRAAGTIEVATTKEVRAA